MNVDTYIAKFKSFNCSMIAFPNTCNAVSWLILRKVSRLLSTELHLVYATGNSWYFCGFEVSVVTFLNQSELEEVVTYCWQDMKFLF